MRDPHLDQQRRHLVPSTAAPGGADHAVARPVVRDAVRRAAHAAAPSAEPSAELTRLLARARALVERYVADRREAGAPVERVIPEVKALVREATSSEGWSEGTDSLVARVVRWSIEAYYDEPSQAHAPRFY